MIGKSEAGVVGEHSKCAEAASARSGGAFGRENVGMSNHKLGEKPNPRKSKVSFAMVISEGLVGPKLIPTGGGDGHRVNIP